MFFNSIEFAIFLPIVFLLYWFFRKSIKIQNIILLLASYFFYGWWDWRFLSLIIFSSLVDFFVGIGLSKYENNKYRKLLLLVSVLVNIGFLGFFKYFNFFAESFAHAFTILGANFEPTRLNIILPVGISFYTFQTLSYSIDVYRKKLEPTKDAIAFFSFVSFFPQLVAGPIERATNLLPQFYSRRQFNYANSVDGSRQIIWGLFKKMVIADNCAVYVNDIFSNYENYDGISLIIGAVFFAFQIYGDFSGYSDIAIGTARLFGFSLLKNFAFPYFSRDIAEFWRRWHISLSTWFRDYVYIPLGGSKGSIASKIRNTFVIFIISGFWHGANWTFVAWGFINACYFIPLMLLNKNRKNTNIVAEGKNLPSIREVFQISFTFILTTFAWIFFRAESITDSIKYISRIFTSTHLNIPQVFYTDLPKQALLFLPIFILIEWIQREEEHSLRFTADSILEKYKLLRIAVYIIILAVISGFNGAQQDFIYFQF